MADYSGLTSEQLVYLLLHSTLTPVEEARITDMIQKIFDNGDLHDPTWRSPITLPQVISHLADPHGQAQDKFKLRTAIESIGSAGNLPTLDPLLTSPGVIGAGPPTTVDDWAVRTVKSIVNTITSDPGVSAQWREFVAAVGSDTTGYIYTVGIGALKSVVEAFAKATAAATPIAGELAGQTMNQILGVNVDSQKLFKDFSGPPSRESIVDIGSEFQKVVDLMFPIEAATTNVLDRGKREFAINNLEAFMGTNMAFQLRSLTIGTIASFVPGFNLEHLEGLHQSINWAYGFGWLSWTVLSAVMANTTTKPLTEFYNSKIKPNDFTEQQAINAFLEKRISETTLNQILDNHGIRDDTRAAKIDMDRKGLSVEQAASAFLEGLIDHTKFSQVMDRERIREDERDTKVKLAEVGIRLEVVAKALNEGIITRAQFDHEMDRHKVRTDVRDALIEEARPLLNAGELRMLYENGLFSEADVKAHVKRRGFDDLNTQATVDIIRDERMFKLQAQLQTTMHHGFVIGTVTESEYTNYLGSLHYNSLEVQLELRRAEIESRSHLQKHLTRGEIIHLVADGSMTVSDGLARLVTQGLPDDDARRLLADAILRHAVSMIPLKVRNACLTPQVEQNVLAAAITTATQLDPLLPLQNKDFFAQARCILEAYLDGSAGGPVTPPPPPPPPPVDPGLPPPDHTGDLTAEDRAYACKVVHFQNQGGVGNLDMLAWILTTTGRAALTAARLLPECQ